TAERPLPDASPSSRPDAGPESIAAATPSARQPSPIAAPSFDSQAAKTPRVPARSALPETGAPDRTNERQRPERTDSSANQMGLTERADRPDRPRRESEDGPQPSSAGVPGASTAQNLASVPTIPELEADSAVAGDTRPDRTALPDASALPSLTTGPRRDRTPLAGTTAEPAPFSGLSERVPDRRPRTDRGDSEGDGPAAVLTESDGPPRVPGVPDAYRLRDLTRRAEIARQYGGTAESEAAVEAALAWFARAQEIDGRWDASRHAAGMGSDDDPTVEPDPDKRNTGRDADAGLTGLVTLTFLGAGYTRSGGKYAPAVDKAVRWLIAQQQPNGSLAGEANYYARMYSHGIALYALAEALALEGDSPDPALKRAVEKAVAFVVVEQYPDGGWRYSQRVRVGDMSMFGWQCMALKSADNAGIRTPAETRAKMIGFLRDRSETVNADGELVQYPYGGLARYKREEGHAVKPSMTAEALFCKQMLGLRRDQPAAKQAVAYLDQHPPELKTWNLYHWYYASLALHAHGGPAWDRWNDRLRELLLEEQYKQGSRAGTWPVRPMRHNYTEYGGTLYSTAMATLCLEVYYRFSPVSGGAAAMDGRPDASE
ncbi:MAG: hypothetical protein AAF907_01085, partial [Planctomycetota bacterium]